MEVVRQRSRPAWQGRATDADEVHGDHLFGQRHGEAAPSLVTQAVSR